LGVAPAAGQRRQQSDGGPGARSPQLLDAFTQWSPRDSGVVELGFHVPGTEPELPSAVGQQVGRRGLAHEQRGIPKTGV
jgi:hypothetical protein